MIEKDDWRRAADEVLADGRRTIEPPTDEEILALQAGELSPEEAERVRALLVYFPELARIASEPFPETDDAKPGDEAFLTANELAADWTSLRKRAGLDDATARLRFWRYSTVAASFIAVVFGTLLLVPRDTETPQFDLEPQLLFPDGRRGVEPTEPAIPLPARAKYYLLIPSLIMQGEYRDYRVEILDLRAEPPRAVWSATGIRRRSDDTFEIWVPRSFLQPGIYRLVAYGVDDKSGSRELARYTFRVPQR